MEMDRRGDQIIAFPAEGRQFARTPSLWEYRRRNSRSSTSPGRICFPPDAGDQKWRSVRVVNGWSHLKRRLDNSVDGVAPWTLHDLRRTFATDLAALGTPIHVTEKLLNHVSGSVSGVAAIYNRHGYMDEMRAAIINWEKRLAEILTENKQSSRVVYQD